MIKKIRASMLTNSLMEYLTDPKFPGPERVCELLESGARPWAVAKPLTEDIPGRSLFYQIYLRTPHPECIDAWFKRAGSLVGEPWKDHNTPNPFHEVVHSASQPEIFTLGLVARLIDAGLVPEAPEGKRLGPWLRRHFYQDLPGMLDVLATHHPQSILNESNWDDEQRQMPAFERALATARQKTNPNGFVAVTQEVAGSSPIPSSDGGIPSRNRPGR